MKRTLTLRTERLAELSAAELAGVVGADVTGGGLLCVTQWATVCDPNRCHSFPNCD